MKPLRNQLLIFGMLTMLGFGFAQSAVDNYGANGITIATAYEIPFG